LKVVHTAIPEVLILEPKVFGDSRGFFLERYNKRDFLKATGLDIEFVQDNHSRSMRNVLRGLHYQIRQPQGKLVWVVVGEIFDVAVDMRKNSPTFGKWVGFELSAQSGQVAWIPPGFAHGFLVASEAAEVLYKTTDYYAPDFERTLLWNDPDLSIQWPLVPGTEPILADKDRNGTRFGSAESFGHVGSTP
jgi:dTDP-4-dehydrorhamnose 3,5-epimerase